jgi:hypothetical protein
VRSRPPSVQPAARPDPASPSAHQALSGDTHPDEWVTSGGAGRIGSKRLDPGAPAAPRPALPAGGGLPWVARASLALYWHVQGQLRGVQLSADHSGRTWSACLPFCPCTTTNDTRCPSVREL